MKTEFQIKQEELELAKNYTIREVKMNIALYKVYKFMLSDLFSFMFLFIPLFFVAKNFDFNLKVCLALVFVHPVVYFFVDRPLTKMFGLDEKLREFTYLIEVNKEILEDKKKGVK